MDEKPTMMPVAFLLMAIVITAEILALTYCKSQDVTEADVAQVTPIERASGCPLDAIEYDAPAFANVGSKSFRVTDRFSGASWWLVKMGRSWAVLPIMDVKEADVG